MKNFLMGILVCYVFAGVLFASAMNNAGPPALNCKGVTFYGMLWPVWPLSLVLNESLVEVPSWAFTFKD